MTASPSQDLHDALPPEIARAILEGKRLRVHAVRVSLVRDDAGKGPGYAIDTLPGEDRSDEWNRSNEAIALALKEDIEALPEQVHAVLMVAAHLAPDPIPLITLETWVSMADNGGAWWEVSAALDFLAVCFPEVVAASERARVKALEEVCRL
jgi:hypothetical protein